MDEQTAAQQYVDNLLKAPDDPEAALWLDHAMQQLIRRFPSFSRPVTDREYVESFRQRLPVLNVDFDQLHAEAEEAKKEAAQRRREADEAERRAQAAEQAAKDARGKIENRRRDREILQGQIMNKPAAAHAIADEIEAAGFALPPLID
jgi:hypothetical protein